MTTAAARSLPIFAYLSPLVGLATGYGASQLEERFAPVGLFPLLVGAATGIGVIACMRLAACACRGGTTTAAVVAALVAVGLMHYLSYQKALAASEVEWQTFQKVQQAAPEAKLNNIPKPLGDFRDFVDRQLLHGRALGAKQVRGAWLIVWWIIDGVLVLTAAGATAFFLSTPPPPTDSQLVQLNQGPPA